MDRYNVIERNAQEIANRDQKPVIIAKSEKLWKFRLFFEGEKLTAHYQHYKTIYPNT